MLRRGFRYLLEVVAGIGAILLAAAGATYGYFGPRIAEQAVDFIGYVPKQELTALQAKLDQTTTDLVEANRNIETSRTTRMRGDAMVWVAKGVGLASTADQCVSDSLSILEEQGYEAIQRGGLEGQPYYVLATFWENASLGTVVVDCYGDRLGILYPSVAVALKLDEKGSGRERANKLRNALVARSRELSPDEVIIKSITSP